MGQSIKKKEQLENLQTRYESVEDTSKELKSELQPLEGAIRELRRREDHAREMHVVMTTTEGRANQVREDRRKLEASIRNVFQGSDEELRRLLEEEDVGVNSMNEEVQQLQNNINKLKHEISDLTNKKLEYSSKQGQIKGEMEVMESKRAMRDELIKNNSEKIDFEPTNDE